MQLRSSLSSILLESQISASITALAFVNSIHEHKLSCFGKTLLMLVKMNDKLFEEEERVPLPPAKHYCDSAGKTGTDESTKQFCEAATLGEELV